MKNQLVKTLRSPLLVLVFFSLAVSSFAQKTSGEFYELRIYRYQTADQESRIHEYLQKAYLPGLHGQGVKTVGVFSLWGNDTLAVKEIYVLAPYASLDKAVTVSQNLTKDKKYLDAGSVYLKSTFDKPPYERFETVLLKAFHLAPTMQKPGLTGARNERVYELRSYESSTEELYRNKVEMFNEGGEIALFKRLNFNAVFYAEVISGKRMPNLMYMTSFDNKESRDAHWKAFVDDPEWKKLSTMPNYQHNVSKADIILLKSEPYSDY